MGCTNAKSSSSGAQGPQATDDPELQFQFEKLTQQQTLYIKSDKKPEMDSEVIQLAEEQVEKAGAVKPWIGQLQAPSNPLQIDPSPPKLTLELDFVNGISCEDARQNLYFTSSSSIIYMSAAVVIHMDISSRKQSFFGAGKVGEVEGHNDDIECLHVDPSRTLCASGQRGKNPSIFVWDIKNKKKQISFLQGVNTKAVKLLKFSKDGKFLFCVDNQDEHQLHVFDITQKKKVCQKSVGRMAVYDMDTSAGGFQGAIACQKVVYFIKFDGNAVDLKRGLFSSQPMEDQMSVCFFKDGNAMVSGSVSGNVLVWKGNSASHCIKMHEGFVSAIFIKENSIYSSGSKDQTLKVYSSESALQGKQDITKSFPLGSSAKSIDVEGEDILVGTRDGRIIQLSGNSNNEIISGHSSGETWGLAIDNKNQVAVTTGDDNKIIAFDLKSNKTISISKVNAIAGKKKKIGGASTLSFFPPNQQSRAVAINPENGHIAIATNEGHVSVRKSVKDLDSEVVLLHNAKEWIEVLKYSPNNKYLAVGSHDNIIYIYEVGVGYTLKSQCAKHNSFITSFDWSTDSKYIASNCGAYELLFYDISNGQQLTSGATQLKDEKWATYSNKICWGYQGIIPSGQDGTHVNGANRSGCQKYMATGDDWGFVNVYNNPNNSSCKANSYRAHSSHVVRVQFDDTDNYLYSVGGFDKTLMRWKIKKAK